MEYFSHPWIQPNSIEKRSYQEMIVKTAKDSNTLCVIPTGLGKTNIAALVAAFRLEKDMKKKILFLAPTKPLVDQHRSSFLKMMKIGEDELKTVTGSDKPEERKDLYEKADVVFSTPQCVTGDTSIFIEGRGISNIKEFVESFPLQECAYGYKKGYFAEVNAHTLGFEDSKISPVKVTHVWKLPANIIYKIKTELGNTLSCTPEHPLLILNSSGKMQWKKTEELNTDTTWVAMPRQIVINGPKSIDLFALLRHFPLRISDKKLSRYVLEEHKKLQIKRGKISRFYHNTIDIETFLDLLDLLNSGYPQEIQVTNKTGRSKSITIPRFLTPKICYLVGAMLGDGHIGNTKSKGNEVVFSAIGNKEVIEKFQQIVLETFGISPKADPNKGIVYYSTALAHVFNALGVPFGNKTGKLRLPDYIFELPEGYITEFLGGLFDTDGSAARHSIIAVSTINGDFAKDVKWLLLRLGIASCIYKNSRENSIIRGKEYKVHHIHNVCISGESQIKKFIELCKPDKIKCRKSIEGLSSIKRHGTRSKDILPISDGLKEAYVEHRQAGGRSSMEILVAYHNNCLSTQNLCTLLPQINSPKAREMEDLLSLPIRWVRILSVEKVHVNSWVYDLTIENSHNFIGNFLINHNTVRNDIKAGILSLRNFSLCIFDEAHRCVGNYAYPYIAKRYMEESSDPLILALTASPGSHLERINDVKKLLFIDNVEIRSRDDPDVRQYIQKMEQDYIEVELPKPIRSIIDYLETVKNERIRKLMNWRIINYNKISKTQILELQQKLVKKKTGISMAAVSVLAEVIKVDHAMVLAETQCLASLHSYFYKLSQDKTTRAAARLLNDKNFQDAMRLTKELIAEGKEHPKMEKLKELIAEQLEKDKFSRIIVFAQFRDTIAEIASQLQNIKNAAPVEFIGQAKKKGKGLSQKEQIQILNEFKMGFHNILCASQVAEEGLDVVETNLVVFYEPVPSAIRKIQRSGRTARTQSGKVTVLVTKDTRDEAYRWSAHNKERKMNKTLYAMQRQSSLEGGWKRAI
jgi:ERCC4-related helicase/intein/homing endonuclease